ncbi:MAG TPA: hypothetical protein VNF72_14505 [Myxococcota bacterium]|nr:hypothetical protein [Myxococcota bacterium]
MRDAGDHARDLIHVARLGLELEHARGGRLHALEHGAHLLDREARDVDAGARLLVRFGGKAEGLARALGVQLDRRGDLAHQPIGVLQELLLLGDVGRQARDRRRDLVVARARALGGFLERARGARHARRGALHALDELAQAVGHAADATRDVPGLVREGRSHHAFREHGEIAAPDRLGRVSELRERVRERAREEEAERAADTERHEEGRPRRHLDAGLLQCGGKPRHDAADEQGPEHEFVRKRNSHAEAYRCVASPA